MKARRCILLVSLPLITMACARCAMNPAVPNGIVLMSYNLQTLFDPVDQGGEYPEFKVAGGSWDEKLYRTRLSALAAAMLAGGVCAAGPAPDVIVVQEAENGRVLRDLASAAGGYPYVVASPDEDSSLACGILSRWPPVSAKAHRARSPDGSPPSAARYILEVELDVDGRRLVILAVHLKSKLGGAAETEPERRAAAALVRDIARSKTAADPSLALLVMGDFNENPDEFQRVGGSYPTAMMAPDAGDGQWLTIDGDRSSVSQGGGVFALFSPWDEAGGYSYRFQGETERIDHILLSPSLVSGAGCPFSFDCFSAAPPEFAVDGQGTPIRWNTGTGSGYSDHLPISARLSMTH